jgi:phage baseplate assembly protein W
MEEVVILDSDRRSLPCRQPVASGGTVRILVNDEFFVPQGGLFTQAVLRAAVSGPYDILEGYDTLTVATSAGTVTVSFGVTDIVTRYTADAVVNFLASQSVNIVDASAENGHLVFTDVFKVGPDSYVKVSGTAATSLGFGAPGLNGNPFQWASRGTQMYPAWRLHNRPDEITNRFPMFDDTILNNPIFKVTYTVPPQRCLRCGGSYIENDYRFDEAGQFIMIENEDLLYQAALKIILTDKGSNPYYPWYGSTIRSRIGSKAVSGVATLINEDVRKALTRYQDLQKEQGKYQKVTFKERLFTILSVNTYPHAQDPTTYMVDVTVQNASSEAINLNIVFSVPGVVALMGSNGLFLNSN